MLKFFAVGAIMKNMGDDSKMETDKNITKKMRDALKEIGTVFDKLEAKGIHFISYSVIGMDCKIDKQEITKTNIAYGTTLMSKECNFRIGNVLIKEFYNGSTNINSHFSIETRTRIYEKEDFEPARKGVN